MSPGTSAPDVPARPAPDIVIGPPTVDDGVACWRLASASRVLDVNSRYAYLIWCRDFSATTVVARIGPDPRARPVGFVTGYRRPDAPTTLMVWQVAVDASARGAGLAGRMLDALVDQVPGIDHLETTITPDNTASIALFTGFARRREARVDVAELFTAEQLSGGEPSGDQADAGAHEPEHRYRIGPFPDASRRPA